MKMITNYLSNLESYLPDDMQQDVREELEASIYGQIEDLKEQQVRQPDEDEVANILQKWVTRCETHQRICQLSN